MWILEDIIKLIKNVSISLKNSSNGIIKMNNYRYDFKQIIVNKYINNNIENLIEKNDISRKYFCENYILKRNKALNKSFISISIMLLISMVNIFIFLNSIFSGKGFLFSFSILGGVFIFSFLIFNSIYNLNEKKLKKIEKEKNEIEDKLEKNIKEEINVNLKIKNILNDIIKDITKINSKNIEYEKATAEELDKGKEYIIKYLENKKEVLNENPQANIFKNLHFDIIKKSIENLNNENILNVKKINYK